MKKFILIVLVFTSAVSVSQAQKKSAWGVKGGFNFPMDGFTFTEAGNNINSIFTEDQRVNGWHAGLYGRIYLGNQLYLGANLLYIQRSNEFIDSTGSEVLNKEINSSGTMLDLVAGVRILNFIRVQGGLNGIVYLDNSWKDTFNTLGAGYTFGAGVDIWKITLEVSYYGSFKSEESSWNGVPLSYNRSDLLVSLGIAL